MLIIYAMAVIFDLIGLNVFLQTIYSPVGVLVTFILVLFETTYTRF